MHVGTHETSKLGNLKEMNWRMNASMQDLQMLGVLTLPKNTWTIMWKRAMKVATRNNKLIMPLRQENDTNL
jgi:hypothetical protein